jgi:holliday junction resolvase Hjr
MVSMRQNKKKGSTAERDLINKFWQSGWSAVRAAGSGSTQYPCPDIIAGNSIKKIAIECKFTSDTSKYFTKKEINELLFFSEKFGAEPWVAVKFNKEPWYFFPINDLQEKDNTFSIKLVEAKIKGLLFEDVIQ